MDAILANLIAQAIGGAVGGNIGGAISKALSQGGTLNSIIGAIGGVVAGWGLQQAGTLGSSTDIGALVSHLAGGGVGGLILQMAVGFIRNKMA